MKLHDELRCGVCRRHPFEVIEVEEAEAHRFTLCVCGQPARSATVSDGDLAWNPQSYAVIFDLRYCNVSAAP